MNSAQLHDAVHQAVAVAALAPSSHNSQPWRFHHEAGRIELHADRERRLPVVDPEDRELEISCGAALEQLLLALHDLGLACQLKLGDSASDLLAVVTVSLRPLHEQSVQPQPTTPRHLDAMKRRRTHRQPFDDRPLRPELLEAVHVEAASRGAWLTQVSPDQRQQVADLVAEGARRQMADVDFRLELARWISPGISRRRDGIRPYGLGVPALLSPAAPLAVRLRDPGRRQARTAASMVLSAPEVVVLGAAGDTRCDRLAVGRALTAILLRLTAEGACASFLNQPVEVPDLRARLQRLVDVPGMPHLVLRIGYGKPARPQPRRQLADILTCAATEAESLPG